MAGRIGQRYLLTTLVIFAAYIVAAHIGLIFSLDHPSVSPVWPPAGIALSALLICGLRFWPAVFAGAFFANFVMAPAGFLAALGIGVGDVLEAFLGAWVLNRISMPHLMLERTRDFAKFITVGSVLTTTTAATIGATSLTLTGNASVSDFGTIWFTWWLGDCVGALIITPFIMGIRNFRANASSTREFTERILFLLTTGVVTGFVFLDWFGSTFPDYHTMPYLIIPLLVWAAVRLGPLTTAVSLVFISSMAILGTKMGYGPFSGIELHLALKKLQLFIGLSAVPFQILATAILERTHITRDLRSEIDIRKRAQQNLHRSEKRFRIVAENIREVFYIYDVKKQELVYISPAYEEIWGRSCQSLYDHPDSFLESVHPEDRDRLRRVVKESRKGHKTSAEYRITQPNGKIRWIWDRGYPVREPSGEVNQVAGIAEDVTEWKEAESTLKIQAAQLMRSNAELEYFASAASHDLKAPLRMISSYVTLLANRYESRLDNDADEFLSYIQDGTKRMALLIDDLLEYSRVSWKPAPLKPTNLNLVVNQVVTDLKGFIDDSGAEVSVDNLPTVIANPSQIRLVFQNIIANALKFNRPGTPPRIEVRAFAQGDTWQISVKDNGIGIAQQDSDRIFKVFQRLHTQQEYSGNGIGLATSQRIVERFGGRIWVESKQGEGSNFFFSLPMADKIETHVPINRKPQVQATMNGSEAQPKPFEILSVDDSHADARLMMELMQSNNEIPLRLKCLNNGGDALDFLFRRGRYVSCTPPDLILLDLDLPNYDGLEILRQVKEDPRLKRIPVLILTGSQRQEDIARSYDLGANGFLKKPPTLNEFDGLIQAIKAFWLGAATLPSNGNEPKPAAIK